MQWQVDTLRWDSPAGHVRSRLLGHVRSRLLVSRCVAQQRRPSDMAWTQKFPDQP